MSALFMPKYDVTKDSGRKITLTAVKITTEVLFDSVLTSRMDRNCKSG
jgi:hypothetical protein